MPHNFDAEHLGRAQLCVEVLDDPDERGRQAVGDKEKPDLASRDLRVDLGPELVFVLERRAREKQVEFGVTVDLCLREALIEPLAETLSRPIVPKEAA